MAFNQFDLSNPGRKLRVVAKIRGISGPDGNSRSVDWISVNRENSEDVTISFGEQSSSRYLVDNCYNENEDNEIIYSREVKPLVLAAFEGHNSTVIAHGARGSGKSYVIQGSIEKPGLAVLATSDFLSMAKENQKSIAVSFYEVDHQDHAVDLLNPEQPPISVLEDHGKIQFKGLAQIPVKSMSEFQNLYLTACSAHKAAPNKGFEPARRSHMGLIVHVLSHNECIKGLVSKMNFVDMAGYEDARRKSSEGSGLADTTKINKSIYALLNVCHALSTNESHIPYRESKLTRMLQDSLRGTSKILLVSCLNPTFCQDTVYMVSLASRSCQWIHWTPLNSAKKSEILARQKVNSHKNQVLKTPLDSTKESISSARQKVTSSKNQVPTTPLDSTQKSTSSALQKVNSQKNQVPKKPLDSTKEISSARQKVTSYKNQVPKTPLDSTQKSTSSARQVNSQKNQVPKTLLYSTKESTSSARQKVTSYKNQVLKTPLDSTQKCVSSARQKMNSHKNQVIKTSLDSTQKCVSSARQKMTSHKNQKPKSVSSTAKTLPGARSHAFEKKDADPLDSTQKCVSSARQKMTSHKNQVIKTSLDSTQKCVSSARQKMTSHKNQKPKSVSSTAKTLPGARSHAFEKKDVAVKSAIKGRKLFDKASHSASIDEKENSISHAPEPLLVIDQLVYQMQDNSLYEAGNNVQLNSRVKKEHSLPYASNIEHNMMKENDDISLNTSNTSCEMELDSIVEKSISEDKEEDLLEKHTPCAGDYSKALSTVDEARNMNEENNLVENGDPSPPISSQLRVLQSLCSSTPLCKQIPETKCISLGDQNSADIAEPRTPLVEQNMCPSERQDIMNAKSPWETFSMRSSGMKNSLVREHLRFLNTAEKEDLKKLKGIGEKRATFILELREESQEPFQSLDDLKDIGLSAKQIKRMMKKEVGELFN